MLSTSNIAIGFESQAQPRPGGGDPNAYDNNTGYNKYYNNADPNLGSGIRNMPMSKECAQWLGLDPFGQSFHFPNGSPCKNSAPLLNLNDVHISADHDNWSNGNAVNNVPQYPVAQKGYSEKQISDAKWSAIVAKRILENISYQYLTSNSALGLSSKQAQMISGDQYMYSYYYTRCITEKVYNDKDNISNMLNSFSGDALTRKMNGYTAGMARGCLNASKHNGHTNAHSDLFDGHLTQWDY